MVTWPREALVQTNEGQGGAARIRVRGASAAGDIWCGPGRVGRMEHAGRGVSCAGHAVALRQRAGTSRSLRIAGSTRPARVGTMMRSGRGGSARAMPSSSTPHCALHGSSSRKVPVQYSHARCRFVSLRKWPESSNARRGRESLEIQGCQWDAYGVDEAGYGRRMRTRVVSRSPTPGHGLSHAALTRDPGYLMQPYPGTLVVSRTSC